MALNQHQVEAIANADAHTNNVALPTYSELKLALDRIAGEISVQGSIHSRDWRIKKAVELLSQFNAA